MPAVQAQAGPIRVGFLTVKTGPLASGGLQMEQGLLTFLKDRKNMLGNRPVELTTADTTGNPAVCRTKMQELVERFNVSCVLGPLAAFEALAIDDYIRSSRTPTLAVAGAEDLTQRKPNPWFTRPGATSAQPSHAMADYAAKELKFKRVATIADDFAFGHENVARLPARVRGCRRQGGAEAVDPAQRARLRHLHLAAQARSRRTLHRACRIERAQDHAPIVRVRAQGQAQGRRRLHADR